ncbi:MAG: M48 family metallopeptidase [Clostridia bacterium]|nr:M48 family metallopeptidase [Clostridia bacterium]
MVVKNYKSRWGTCYKNKYITLNYKLMMLDVDLIDYVIIHELCHTIYFDHQKEFKNLLNRITKNSAGLNKKLKEMSFVLKIEY